MRYFGFFDFELLAIIARTSLCEADLTASLGDSGTSLTCSGSGVGAGVGAGVGEDVGAGVGAGVGFGVTGGGGGAGLAVTGVENGSSFGLA